jgi:hypothetical protein
MLSRSPQFIPVVDQVISHQWSGFDLGFIRAIPIDLQCANLF